MRPPRGSLLIMTENSKIEWTDHTFNPWMGCTKVGPGCDNCYAESMMDHRYHRVRWGAGQPRKRTSEANWRKPVTWNRKAEDGPRPRVFCASLADVFDNEVPDAWRSDLWRLIQQTPNLDWLLLTKRIGNAHRMLPAFMKPWPNLWLGATVVNQEEADRDIPKLLAVPAAVRFLSCEPLLGPIDLEKIGVADDVRNIYPLNWLICGGESGPKARPMEFSWALDIRYQCRAAGVPFFMKQGSQANWPNWKDMTKWPEPLQCREYPNGN